MKALRVSRNRVPIGEVTTHSARVVRDRRLSGRPVVITQNGRPAAVPMASADFDALTEGARFVAAVRQGHADADAGRLSDDAELARELDAEFGRRER